MMLLKKGRPTSYVFIECTSKLFDVAHDRIYTDSMGEGC